MELAAAARYARLSSIKRSTAYQAKLRVSASNGRFGCIFGLSKPTGIGPLSGLLSNVNPSDVRLKRRVIPRQNGARSAHLPIGKRAVRNYCSGWRREWFSFLHHVGDENP